MLRGLWPCFCFLLSENSSHTPRQQSLPKHRQTKGNQPAHHWKERSETRMPTGEPKDTPRHGLCLAHVQVHRCDLCFIYLYFFSGSFPHFPLLYARSSHFCCPFHSQGHCNRQCPLALGPPHVAFRVCCLTYVCACVWAVQVRRLFWLQHVHSHPPSYVDRLSSLLSISLALEELPLVFTRTRCQDLLLAFPKMRTTPCHHVGHFFSELACNGKEGFWILENTTTEDLDSPCPWVQPPRHQHTDREILGDRQDSQKHNTFSPLPPLSQ